MSSGSRLGNDQNNSLNKKINFFIHNYYVTIIFVLIILTFFSNQRVFSQEKSKKAPGLTHQAPSSVPPKRITSILIDQAKPQSVYLSPGLGSMVVFPCFLSGAFVGNESEVQVQFSPSSKKILLLNLKSNFSHPTNMIATCENQRVHFVFDLIPSQRIHQDLIEIRAGYGHPEFVETLDNENGANVGSKRKVHSLAQETRVLIEESKPLQALDQGTVQPKPNLSQSENKVSTNLITKSSESLELPKKRAVSVEKEPFIGSEKPKTQGFYPKIVISKPKLIQEGVLGSTQGRIYP